MKIIFNKLVLVLSLVLILPILTIQNSMADCGKPDENCGGDPFIACCDPLRYECIDYTNGDVITGPSRNFGLCEKKKDGKEKSD